MIRKKALLKLLADDLHSLHASALALEKDLGQLAVETESHDLASITVLLAQMNRKGFSPIETMLRDAGVELGTPAVTREGGLSGVLAEASLTRARAESRRISPVNALAIMRRAARYMEMYCASTADSAARLRLDALERHLRAWSREWIGLELHLNAVAARPRTREAEFVAA